MEVTDLPQKRLNDYRPILDDDKVDAMYQRAKDLAGLRVAHVNSTSFGGGVAEILQNFVPLMRDVGIDTHWYVIDGPPEFFTITKKMHNALQGNQALHLSEEERALYVQVNAANARRLKLDHDVVIIHDPQPAALIHYTPHDNATWIWRCHIDLSAPNLSFWGFLSPYVQQHEFYVFHRPDYAREDLPTEHVIIMPPSIDPLSAKNLDLHQSALDEVLVRFGVDTRRPLIVQVGRFDPWKGLFDVIDTYRLVKESVPEVQLALVGIMASDDPEGWVYFERTLRRLGDDRDGFIVTNLTGAHAHEVNAFQGAATLVLQMSTREGFGLTVSEAMWKHKPVIGRAVGGIKLQIIDGETGFIVADAAEAADRCVYLLRQPDVATAMGDHAKERVRNNFLITSHLERYIEMLLRAQTREVALQMTK